MSIISQQKLTGTVLIRGHSMFLLRITEKFLRNLFKTSSYFELFERHTYWYISYLVFKVLYAQWLPHPYPDAYF